MLPHITRTGMFNEVQAKWPLFFPLLEPDWVAEQIVIAAQEEREQVRRNWDLTTSHTQSLVDGIKIFSQTSINNNLVYFYFLNIFDLEE